MHVCDKFDARPPSDARGERTPPTVRQQLQPGNSLQTRTRAVSHDGPEHLLPPVSGEGFVVQVVEFADESFGASLGDYE